MHILPEQFYAQDATDVAPALLGQILVSYSPVGETAGRIVETEAYLSTKDPASHSSSGKTKRNKAMFGPPGRAYVYFIYGNHYCFNVVTGRDGQGEAVLVRALEPLWGIPLMQQRRKKKNKADLTSGPGKLTQALNINLCHNGKPLKAPPLVIFSGEFSEFEVVDITSRVGISKGKEKLLRFYLKNNKYVSAHRG